MIAGIIAVLMVQVMVPGDCADAFTGDDDAIGRCIREFAAQPEALPAKSDAPDRFSALDAYLTPEQISELAEMRRNQIAHAMQHSMQTRNLYIGTYSQQRIQGSLVFALVYLVVLCGLGFSGFQLWCAMRLAAASTRRDTIPNSDDGDEAIIPGAGALEVSYGDASVKTASIGVAVLIISLAFFYLMLDRVYKINDPNVGRGSDPTTYSQVEGEQS
jgi:hypothetical protein